MPRGLRGDRCAACQARLDPRPADAPTMSSRARWSAPGARVAVVETPRPARCRTLMLTDLLWARAARRAARELLDRARGPPRPVGDLLHDDRRAALAAAWRDPLRRPVRGESPGSPRALAASARAPPPARSRRCCCPGARAGSPRPAPPCPAAPIARWCCRSRSRPRHPMLASATSPRSPTPATPARRASIACSPHGGAYAGPASGSLVVGIAREELARSRVRAARRGHRGHRLDRRAELRALMRRSRVVRLRAAPRGLRARPARGARRGLPARHDSRSRSLRRAGAGARAGPAARQRRPRRRARATRSTCPPPGTPRAPRSSSSRLAGCASTGSSSEQLLPRLLG